MNSNFRWTLFPEFFSVDQNTTAQPFKIAGSSRTRSSRRHHHHRQPLPPVRRPFSQRLRAAIRIVTAWVFSNVGICVLVVAYLSIFLINTKTVIAIHIFFAT